MISDVKALIVVLVISAVIFRVAKPIALKFSSEQDYLRRRNVWFLLTITAFVSPSFWLYVLIAIPTLIWAGRRDSNPVALYLILLHVVPPISIEIPVAMVHALFDLDNYRLLSLFILIPTALKLRKNDDPARVRGLSAADVLLLGFGLLQVALFVPPDLPNHVILADSFTNILRRAFLFLIDVYLLFYVVSRSCSTRRAMVEAQAAFLLSSAIIAALSFFEFLRHWLLYVDIAARWTENPTAGFYLMRGDMVRAQVTSGHPLALGYLLAVAFGFWLYLKRHIESRWLRVGGTLLFWLGLLGAYSRGPWIGAIVAYFAYAALGSRALLRLSKAAVVATFAIGVIAISPFSDRVVSVLPFMGGTIDSGSTGYRERLAQRSWELIKQSPLFGDQLAYLKMEGLRQGEGIIDLVDTYAQVALFYGLSGLICFAGPMLIGLWRTLRRAWSNRGDADLEHLGLSLAASILGALTMLSAASFEFGIAKMYWALAALAAAYAAMRIPVQER